MSTRYTISRGGCMYLLLYRKNMYRKSITTTEFQST